MIAEATNTFDWWATTGGPLGAIVFVTFAAAGAAVWQIWFFLKPYLAEKQRLSLQREESQCKLYDTLRENEGARMQMQAHQTRLIENIHENQKDHAKDCRRTDQSVEKIARHLGIE